MALPETTPNLATNPALETKQEGPLKVTWLQHMLDEQKKAIVQDSPGDKPQKSNPAEQLTFVASKLEESFNKTASVVEQAPAPKQEAITWGLEGKPLESSPISGSILKLLMEEPGMKEKIDAGIKNGHTYNIVHQPGQKNFFLWDKWNETKNGVTATRKNATPFLIKNPEDVKPEVKEVEVAPVIEEPAPTMVPLESREFMKIPMIPEDEGQLPAKKLDKLPEIKKEASPVNAPNSHWALMRSKFSNNAFNEKNPQEQAAFQQKADSQIQPHFVDKIREYEATAPLEKLLQGNLEGELLKEWNIAKTMPTNAFLYPEKYLWEGPDGQPMKRTLDNYPIASLRIRDKLVGVLGTFQKMNPLVDLEKKPLGEAFDEFAKEDLV